MFTCDVHGGWVGGRRQSKSNFNGNWRKNLFFVVWWLPRKNVSMLLLQIFRRRWCFCWCWFVNIFSPFPLFVGCVKAKVNFHLIGHIISLWICCCFFLFYIIVLLAMFFYAQLNTFTSLKFSNIYKYFDGKQALHEEKSNNNNNNRSHSELGPHFISHKQIFVPCHVSLIQPWLNSIEKSVNMNFIFLSNKQKNFRQFSRKEARKMKIRNFKNLFIKFIKNRVKSFSMAYFFLKAWGSFRKHIVYIALHSNISITSKIISLFFSLRAREISILFSCK